jgi:hypothetical protein
VTTGTIWGVEMMGVTRGTTEGIGTTEGATEGIGTTGATTRALRFAIDGAVEFLTALTIIIITIKIIIATTP